MQAINDPELSDFLKFLVEGEDDESKMPIVPLAEFDHLVNDVDMRIMIRSRRTSGKEEKALPLQRTLVVPKSNIINKIYVDC